MRPALRQSHIRHTPRYCGYKACPNNCFADEVDTEERPQSHGQCNGLGQCQCNDWYVGADCGCRNCTLGRGDCVRAPGKNNGYAYGDCKCFRFPEEEFNLRAFDMGDDAPGSAWPPFNNGNPTLPGTGERFKERKAGLVATEIDSPKANPELYESE